MCWTEGAGLSWSCAVISDQGPSVLMSNTTSTVLQGEHFNKQLQVNFHQADTDTLLTHSKFHLHSINCYKYITDKQLNPRPWGPSPLVYLHTLKGWDFKIQPFKWMAFLQPLKSMGLINSERTKPRQDAVTSDWQLTGFLQKEILKNPLKFGF